MHDNLRAAEHGISCTANQGRDKMKTFYQKAKDNNWKTGAVWKFFDVMDYCGITESLNWHWLLCDDNLGLTSL